MRVYQGKLNTNTSYATKDETITLVTNGGFRQGSTAVITGQWTVSYTGVSKKNYSRAGTITKLEDDQIEIFVDEDQYYWFEGKVSDDQIVLNMKKDGDDNYGEAELSLVFSET
ncbi:uncharacterized protein N7477_005407 [Penicillium maclennaniae]|uniref:uncharacterized protein n=1 Tax=Penicillium maclennaniae TaxID=1343394 RepID=UPI00253F79C0|nr:uncharacterized protein N7477_005407 [Penicillium maclennaniae]KAJ5670044.1 hypothetical protein N7477_005407 [Penicillium maclennaniae]